MTAAFAENNRAVKNQRPAVRGPGGSTGRLTRRLQICTPSLTSAALLLAVAALLLAGAGCREDPTAENRPAPALTPREAAARAGFTEILETTGEAFLALDPVKQKRFLYLTGSHYDMGFQTGLLAGRATAVMVHDYCNEFLFEMLDLPFHHQDLGPLWDLVRNLLIELTLPSAARVPAPLLREMEGIVDGYAEARRLGRPGTERPVELADVLVLNQGMDVVSGLTYNTLGKLGIACNQFACWGSRTRGGALFHGRDFQFYNAGVYQDEALVAVYVPRGSADEPAAFPFCAVTAPGFVGVATGLNARGISVGLDVVHSWPAAANDPGLGGLLLLRRVMEEAATLEEAVSLVRDEKRGCPWIYLIADAKTPAAAVLETVQSPPLEPWMADRYEENLGLARNLFGEEVEPAAPPDGVAMRSADFVLEERFRGKTFELPGYRNNPKYPDNRTLFNLSFPDPGEDSPELVAATNHFLLPGMRLYQWSPLVWVVWMSYWPSSEWRYQTLVELLIERTGPEQPLDWETAWTTIDFLNPATREGAFFYGPETDQPVAGHVCLMDGQDLVLRALYGYYDQPWVQVSLADFLP